MKNKRIIPFLLLLLSGAVIILTVILILSSLRKQPDSTLRSDTGERASASNSRGNQEEPVVPSSEEGTEPDTDLEPAEPQNTPDQPSPEDPVHQRALSILNKMTVDEKLCQLMIVNPGTITGVQPTREAGEISKKALSAYPVAGFSFGAESLSDREQVTSMLNGFQQMAPLGLFFCVDEEGGTVSRVMRNPNLGTTKIDSMFSYRDQGTDIARNNAFIIGTDLISLGFNVDFAPVADVWSNPDNRVIGSRAYSDSFQQAAELIPAAVEGFHSAGILCTIKHFPGHGSTETDSHKGLPRVDKSWEELWQTELLPFRAGIAAGADMVMIGHLLLPKLDPDYPASLSQIIVTDHLRGKMGFTGVVITDSLGMGALTEWTETERCVLAIEAGCDLLLGVRDVSGTLQGLRSSLTEGRLSEERINESVLRILELKLRSGILPMQ